MSDAAPSAPSDPEGFVRANTALEAPRLIPEIRLYVATQMIPIWHASEEALAERGVPPPYWAFAWAGGQALARYILDRPETVRGKRVLDFAAGSGLAGIAAAKAGARTVEASEIDAYACAAAALNAEANGVALEIRSEDLIGTDEAWDVVVCGDVCYEQPMAERVEAWLKTLAEAGTTVLLGDPNRSYLPKRGLRQLAKYTVPTTVELEDSDLRNAMVWRVAARDEESP
jgi:predicted nicotinamide N-methyase